ncbi:hypothetical protein BJ170DRAFT_277270 [Xylariales sp. AK1849]|nr:hypothetical protein BJ170DRAFT_277270 [Xylariales sp. AK1849]
MSEYVSASSDEHRAVSSPLERSSNYDFASELQPGLWKVIRKADRFQLLARDVTDDHQDQVGALTHLGALLHPKYPRNPDNHNLLEPISRILNHENLVNLADWIQVDRAPTVKLGLRPVRQYILWDFCNAGTLENLFMPYRNTPQTDEQQDALSQELEQAEEDREERRKRDEIERLNRRKNHHFGEFYNADEEFPPPGEPERNHYFLPEGFCWHVLCSLLKALAWLHHGVREDYNPQKKKYETIRADVDWQTILHRQIMPSNIFFCQPQTRYETYGLCKLGNYSEIHISGHFNGILGDRLPPADGKILAAPRGHSALEDLVAWEESGKTYSHPPLNGQPYTILSEYRSVGDIIMAMMIAPSLAGNGHFDNVRTQRSVEWNRMLRQSTYTGELKNLVYVLMSKDNTEHMSSQNLYLRAKKGYQNFRTIKAEGKAIITTDHLKAMQELEESNEHWKQKRMNDDVHDVLAKQDDHFEEPEQPAGDDELNEIYVEIAKMCGKINNREY